MSKLRRLLFVGIIVIVTGAAVVSIPDVRWPIVGWWKGEPIWQNRPLSWWRAQVRACHVSTVDYRGVPGETKTLSCHVDEPYEWPRATAEAGGLEVLIALLDDPDPKVRYYAAHRLGDFRESGMKAVEGLRRHADDSAEVMDGFTVGYAAKRSIKRIETAAAKW